MKVQEPYLSIVVASRNDDHGGNLLPRMQLFVDSLVQHAEKTCLPIELVIVEWNPPKTRPALCEALKWPHYSHGEKYLQTRILRVIPEIHNQLEHANRVPLFQMRAKNVGIRRAKGQFILATNIDILFSSELFEFFASKKLDENKIYRIDRRDVPSEIPPGLSQDDLLGFCRSNVFCVHTRDFSHDFKTGKKTLIYDSPEFFRQERLRTRVKQSALDWMRPNRPAWVHTNSSGDFQLMHKSHWNELRGYPELSMSATHLDGLLGYAAHANNVTEETLTSPLEIYHIDHTRAEGDSLRNLESERIDPELSTKSIKLPVLTFPELRHWGIQMRRERKPKIWNGENWGLGHEALEEVLC
jgi:hypothetical protein